MDCIVSLGLIHTPPFVERFFNGFMARDGNLYCGEGEKHEQSNKLDIQSGNGNL
jgi:hypothetical protein